MNVSVSQAMACGLPVITTSHSGLPEQVRDGVNGFVAAEASPQDLAEKILAMLEHPERWTEFGRAGRQIVEEKYNAQQRIDRQIAVYQDLSKKSGNMV